MKVNQRIHQAKLSKWTALFQEQAASGLTVRDWCNQKSLSIHAFYYWKRLAKEMYVSSIMPDIVPVSINEVPPAPVQDLSVQENLSKSYKLRNSSSPSTPNDVTVSIGDVNISIGACASDELISNIIKAVRHA